MLPVVLVWHSGQSGSGALVDEPAGEALAAEVGAAGSDDAGAAAVEAAASKPAADGEADGALLGAICGRIAAAANSPAQAKTTRPATLASTISQIRRFATTRPPLVTGHRPAQYTV